MKSERLLQDIELFIRFSIAALMFLTFWGYLTGHQAFGFTGLWYELDVRIEGSLATWGESMLMMLCALPAYWIFRTRSSAVPRSIGGFFLFMAAVSLFFSADEMISIHEMLSSKASEAIGLGNGSILEGFSWVLIYAPAAAAGLVWLFFIIRGLFERMSSEQRRRTLRTILVLTLLVAGVLAFEVLESAIYHSGKRDSIFPCFEESLELLIIWFFYRFLLSIIPITQES